MDNLFQIDALSQIMMGVVLCIMLTVGHFSTRYLRGDPHKVAFFAKLSALTISLILLVCANHLGVLLLAWISSNLILVALMAHNKYWKAARASALLAAEYLGLGSLAMLIAFSLLYLGTGALTVQAILEKPAGSWHQSVALLLLLLCILIQSAALPFHRHIKHAMRLLAGSELPTISDEHRHY
jgi:NAD(P)H-quinone oxidoreductase subunit 5